MAVARSGEVGVVEVVAGIVRRWVGNVPAVRAAVGVVVVAVVAVEAAAAAAVAVVVCVIAVAVGVVAAWWARVVGIPLHAAAHATAHVLQHRPTCWHVGAGASEPMWRRASV